VNAHRAGDVERVFESGAGSLVDEVCVDDVDGDGGKAGAAVSSCPFVAVALTARCARVV
jgi:hypothetical protein